MLGIADAFVLISTTRTLDGFVRRFDHLLNDAVSERCRFSLALSQPVVDVGVIIYDEALITLIFSPILGSCPDSWFRAHVMVVVYDCVVCVLFECIFSRFVRVWFLLCCVCV